MVCSACVQHMHATGRKRNLQINSSGRLKQHELWGKRKLEVDGGGVCIVGGSGMLIAWMGKESGEGSSLTQPAQPGDPVPIGAWPLSRTLCQMCQFDGRFRPKWHFSRAGERGPECETSQVVREKEGSEAQGSIHKHKWGECRMVTSESILCYFRM